MFIPVWGLFTIGIVWVVSMLHMNRTGFQTGWKLGTQEGIVSAVNFFRSNNMINEDGDIHITIEDE